MKRLVWLAVVVVVVAGAIGGYFYLQSRGNTPQYRTARVQRGPLTAAVSATGNLNAVITVQVGSQVSGQIKELRADFNTVVKRNQVIARIDPETFEAKVNQATADVDSARATVGNQQAQVERARADMENAKAAWAEARAQTAKAQVAVVDSKRSYDRNAALFKRELIAQSDLDSAQANHDSAVAQLDSGRAHEEAAKAAITSAEAQLRVAQAALESARAQVKQKEAGLRQAQVDLDHTTITAPVDGVVVSRQVDVGQTVAASLQAPVLFTIAQDLTKMQVETSVDEADIGRVAVNGAATFTVDAFSGETFRGQVVQVRKAAQVLQNVVTYTVVIAVANPDLKLLPGMTANVKLIVADRPNALKIPNAALRFRPPGSESTAESGPAPAAPRDGGQGGGRPGAGGPPTVEAIRDRLVKALGLTPEQQAKLEPILQESRQQTMALRGQDLPESDRQARVQKIREAARGKIRQILTPEQQQKYDEFSGGASGGSGIRARVWIVGPDGKPRAVPVTLGISDGTMTEIVRGDLADGQEIIIGMTGGGTAGRSQGATSGTSGGPRLRL